MEYKHQADGYYKGRTANSSKANNLQLSIENNVMEVNFFDATSKNEVVLSGIKVCQHRIKPLSKSIKTPL